MYGTQTRLREEPPQLKFLVMERYHYGYPHTSETYNGDKNIENTHCVPIRRTYSMM